MRISQICNPSVRIRRWSIMSVMSQLSTVEEEQFILRTVILKHMARLVSAAVRYSRLNVKT